jgi:transposase
MAVADRHGLPVAVGIASGQRNEQKLVVETLNARFVGPLPKKLIGDTAYDSDPLDRELASMGVEMISPHHPRRRKKTQDGRKLRRYRRRWHIERLFAWLMRSRRLVTRYECRAENFLGFVQLACIQILVRRLSDAF